MFEQKNLKILTYLGVSGLAILLTTAVVSNGGALGTPPLHNLTAEDCEHKTVEHYIGQINPVDGSGHVEHWACCECHSAWADEEKTIPLGNTIQDRTKISFDNNVFWNVDWANASKPIYNIERGIEFDCALNNLGTDERTALETMTPVQNPVDKNVTFVYFYLTNHSTEVVRVDVHPRNWDPKFYDGIYLGPNETKLFTVTRDEWNSKQSGNNYGIAVLVYNTAPQIAGDYLTISMPHFVCKNGEFVNKYLINSDYTNWEQLSLVHNEQYGIVSIGDFGEMTKQVQICYNGLSFNNDIKYCQLYIGVYNPKDFDVNIRINASASGPDYTSFFNFNKTLKPGWNDVYLRADLFNFERISLITIYLDDVEACKGNGWKFSQIIGKVIAEEVRLERIKNTSNYSGDWTEFPTTEDTIYGTVTLCNLSILESMPRNFAIVWEGAKKHDVGEYDIYYFAMFNPTQNKINNITFNACDSGWNTISYKSYITLNPGWNKIMIPANLLEADGLAMFSINVSQSDAPSWAGDGWLISNFYGLR